MLAWASSTAAPAAQAIGTSRPAMPAALMNLESRAGFWSVDPVMEPLRFGDWRHCARSRPRAARRRTMCRRRHHGHEDRHFMSDLAPGMPARLFRARLLPTVAVAAVIAAVALGGLGLDGALAAPSAGTLDIGASVTITCLL